MSPAIILMALALALWIIISIHDRRAKAMQREEKKVEGFFSQIIDDDERLTCPSFVVLDVETTGLDPSSDRIIEFAARRYIDGEPASEYQTLINPCRVLPAKITELTGIRERDVRDAPTFRRVASAICAMIGDLPVVAHNAKFDAEFLVRECERAGIALNIRYIDTVRMARWAFPGLENYKLKTLIPELGLLDHAQDHRAMSDVDATARLFLLCRKRLSARRGSLPPEPVSYAAPERLPDPEPVPEPVPAPKPVSRREAVADRKRQAAEAGLACCPRCGSTSLSLGKKGFGGGKAAAGMFLTGSLGGAVVGTAGMNKKKITCLNCGYTYRPGKNRV